MIIYTMLGIIKSQFLYHNFTKLLKNNLNIIN